MSFRCCGMLWCRCLRRLCLYTAATQQHNPSNITDWPYVAALLERSRLDDASSGGFWPPLHHDGWPHPRHNHRCAQQSICISLSALHQTHVSMWSQHPHTAVKHTFDRACLPILLHPAGPPNTTKSTAKALAASAAAAAGTASAESIIPVHHTAFVSNKCCTPDPRLYVVTTPTRCRHTYL
jgi:hypothetical protein